MFPSVEVRAARAASLLPAGGVIELQLEFPSPGSCDQVIVLARCLSHVVLMCLHSVMLSCLAECMLGVVGTVLATVMPNKRVEVCCKLVVMLACCVATYCSGPVV